MRVITGTAKGRKLKTLEGENVRPTIERVKEAVFSIIQFEIEGRRVLDLFAGSGQLGIEALSRSAASAVFIDADKAAVAVVKENLEVSKLADKATVMQTDALAFLQTSNLTFDIAFLDPPYGMACYKRFFRWLPQKSRRAVLYFVNRPLARNCPKPLVNSD